MNHDANEVMGRELEEQIPIKQGLKQEVQRFLFDYDSLEEQIPIKQGLKLNSMINLAGCVGLKSKFQ